MQPEDEKDFAVKRQILICVFHLKCIYINNLPKIARDKINYLWVICTYFSDEWLQIGRKKLKLFQKVEFDCSESFTQKECISVIIS